METRLVKEETATKIKWVLMSDTPITEDMAKAYQDNAGYMVAGYGFYRFNVLPSEAVYMASWVCSAVCE